MKKEDIKKNIKSGKIGLIFSLVGIALSILFFVLMLIAEESVIMPLLLVSVNVVLAYFNWLTLYKNSRLIAEIESENKEE